MHHWDAADPGVAVRPRDGSAIRWIQSPGKNPSERACCALFDGELDALGVTESQLPILCASDEVRRLFENSREIEANYFRKTKILPIMHVLALQKEVAEKCPDLPEKLFRLYAEAKRWAQRWRRGIPSLIEAWSNHHLAEEGQIFGTDPWVYGLEANRHVIDKFLFYCAAQGIAARSLTADDLFHPSTRHLRE